MIMMMMIIILIMIIIIIIIIIIIMGITRIFIVIFILDHNVVGMFVFDEMMENLLGEEYRTDQPKQS